jgi:hypothetical protein
MGHRRMTTGSSTSCSWARKGGVLSYLEQRVALAILAWSLVLLMVGSDIAPALFCGP